MRTTRTHNGRTTRNGFFKSHKGSRILTENYLADHRGGVLAKQSKELLALNVNAHSAASILNERIEFFNYVNGFAFGCKIFEQLFGKRPNNAKLAVVDLISKSLFCVLISNTCGDNANVSAVIFDGVQGAICRKGLQLLGSFLNNNVTLDGVCRHHNVLCNVLLVFLYGVYFSFAKLNEALRVRYARGKANEYGSIKFFAQIECELGIVAALK